MMNKEKPTKFRIGVVSNVWEVEADNADIACCWLSLHLRGFFPIAIYEPEGAKSRFQIVRDEEAAKAMGEFLAKNKLALHEANKTFKKV